ncbi:hypothetical protein BHM03_00034427 [Ensete ventricosum]|nr:hypothetical protein BHM03_00034427 [Ensete ventricosum]
MTRLTERLRARAIDPPSASRAAFLRVLAPFHSVKLHVFPSGITITSQSHSRIQTCKRATIRVIKIQRRRRCKAAPLDNYVGINADGGDRRGIFGEDGGCLAANPLGGLLDQKLVSSELLLLPPLSRQFRHGQEKEGMWGLSEELYLSRLSSTGKGSSRRLAGSCQAPDKRFRWQ